MTDWINVEERLPEDCRHVIVCLLGISTLVGHYNHGKAKWRLGLETKDRKDGGVVPVTHWMPLPEPPVEP